MTSHATDADAPQNPSAARGVALERALAVARRRGAWVIGSAILFAVAVFVLSHSQRKMYTATTSLVFNNTNIAQSVAGLSAVSATSTPQSVQDTNVALIKIGDMAAKTASAIGNGLTEANVKSDLSIAVVGDTNVVTVAATTDSPAGAAQLANTYSRIFVQEQSAKNRHYYTAALNTVEQQIAKLAPAQRNGAQAIALQERAQSLSTLAELPTSTAEIAAAATVPTSPSSPQVFKDTVIGGVLGLLVGLLIAVLLERFDQRIREPRDLEAVYRLPLLGAVPQSAAYGRGNEGDPRKLAVAELEPFHFIRAHLRYFDVDRDLRTLMVASAVSGDGKTTVATNLGHAAALTGSNVLLIEADLRRPTMAGRLGLNDGPGVADILIGATSMIQATQFVETDGSADAPHASIAVLVAGSSRPPNPGELLESHAMERLLNEAASEYDFVIVDTPPLMAVSDAYALLGKVDGVIVVGRVGHGRRDVAARLAETLGTGGGPLLGVVANGVRTRGGAVYGYEYDYGRSAARTA